MRDFVYDVFKTKYKEGYTNDELLVLIKLFDDGIFSMKIANSELFCNTCMLIDGETINYHTDVIQMITRGLISDHTSLELNRMLKKNYRKMKLKKILKNERNS